MTVDVVTPAPAAPARRRRLGWPHLIASILGLSLAALVPAAGWESAQVEKAMTYARTHAGPDYVQTSATQQAARACETGMLEYSEDACQRYTMASAGSGLARFPVEQGGSCTLHSRFDCAQAAGLEQWSQDVPLWRPWDLHNGRPGMWLNGLVGAFGALALAGVLSLLGASRVTWRRALVWPIVGGLAGLVLMDLSWHQDDPHPSIPGRYALIVAVVAALAAYDVMKRKRVAS